MELLKKLCSIAAPSGDESAMTNFLLKYIHENKTSWKNQPQIFAGEGFQDCIVLVFGQPRTAAYAHIDSIGYMVKHGKELIKIGSPKAKIGSELVGSDTQGDICCKLTESTIISDNDANEKSQLQYEFSRNIDKACCLTYKPIFIDNGDCITSNYLDNRLGVWNLLEQAKTLENGALVFTTWEEVGGGSVEFLAKFLYEKFNIKQALISDITWVTESVLAGKGCAISVRDSRIPRRSFVNKIIDIAKQNNIPYQIEVEDAGGSDGGVIQRLPYPIDWCFVGAPELNPHCPNETVDKTDIESMINLYKCLLDTL